MLVPGSLIAATAFVQNSTDYKLGWPAAVPGQSFVKAATNTAGMVDVAVAKSITQVSSPSAAMLNHACSSSKCPAVHTSC